MWREAGPVPHDCGTSFDIADIPGERDDARQLVVVVGSCTWCESVFEDSSIQASDRASSLIRKEQSQYSPTPSHEAMQELTSTKAILDG
jgi:hypothetical protein